MKKLNREKRYNKRPRGRCFLPVLKEREEEANAGSREGEEKGYGDRATRSQEEEEKQGWGSQVHRAQEGQVLGSLS